MLAADGGTVADKTGPEKGGAIRCWTSPNFGNAGWSPILKVNQVSVTIHRRHQFSPKPFTETIAFDKIKAVMTKAQVDAARAEGRVRDISADGQVGFILAPPAPAVINPPAF